jgi:hypothetical protein
VVWPSWSTSGAAGRHRLAARGQDPDRLRVAPVVQAPAQDVRVAGRDRGEEVARLRGRAVGPAGRVEAGAGLRDRGRPVQEGASHRGVRPQDRGEQHAAGLTVTRVLHTPSPTGLGIVEAR